ncbi:MAG: Nuclear control of ATPase protein 2 [Geoglossum umbratile]|nr:MAG: Nuclear control of ATPase protein 2 [Geoglossum umbratile]
MSLVADLVRRVDLQLERLQSATCDLSPSSPTSRPLKEPAGDAAVGIERAPIVSELAQIIELQRLIRLLSTTASSKPLLGPTKLERILEQANFSTSTSLSEAAHTRYEAELEWLLLSKATVQIYGLILNTLLEQTFPLNDDIWYWDEVLGSYSYTALYSVQTSPSRLWHWTSGVYQDARRWLESHQNRARNPSPEVTTVEANQSSRSLTERWGKFYGLLKDSVRDRSMADIQHRVMSPFAFSRSEARQKRAGLKKFRGMSATGLGILMNECLSFDVDHEGNIVTKGRQADTNTAIYQDEWKNVVEKSVALMEAVLRKATSLDIGIAEFEDAVFASTENGSEPVGQEPAPPSNIALASRAAILSKRLQQILQVYIPVHTSLSKSLVSEYGRPSHLVRYWFPGTVLLLSSSTIFRILISRKAAIAAWMQEFGGTVLGFWENWVVDPIKKIIGTIRHDEGSELALMSRRSLEGDRESLERMVVDYVIDHPRSTAGPPLSEAEIGDIKNKVREGDLTPVLMAYERDLRTPLMGTIRGDLIRTLLIQIQKTKVDVEVAIGGIDALLKSQELVFGFVGLTPGILVCFGVSRWLGKILGSYKGPMKGKQQGAMLRQLRNIDRILTTSRSPNNGMLSYGEHGLLLCEVDSLRKLAKRIMPSDINREFVEDVDDLIDIRIGVGRQLRVVERIRWGFAKWLN